MHTQVIQCLSSKGRLVTERCNNTHINEIFEYDTHLGKTTTPKQQKIVGIPLAKPLVVTSENLEYKRSQRKASAQIYLLYVFSLYFPLVDFQCGAFL